MNRVIIRQQPCQITDFFQHIFPRDDISSRRNVSEKNTEGKKLQSDSQLFLTFWMLRANNLKTQLGKSMIYKLKD